MRRVVALSFLLLLPAASPALADDHRAPRAELLVQGQRSAGTPSVPDQWSSADGQTCAFGVATGFIGFRRRAVEVTAGMHLARVRIYKAQRPDEVRVRAWRKVDAEDRPDGGQEVLKRRLVSITRDGTRVAWDVLFKVEIEDDLYLHLAGRWRDREGCGEMQKAGWTFHLKAA